MYARLALRFGIGISLLLAAALVYLLLVLNADLSATQKTLSATAASLTHQEAVNVALKQSNNALVQTNDMMLAEAITIATARNDATLRGNALDADLVALGEQHAQLGMEHRALTAEHDTLQSAHGKLMTEHDDLTTQHDALTSQHRTLTEAHDDLTTTHNALDSQYKRLTVQHRSLLDRVGDVERLETQIATLEGQLQPLLLSANSRETVGFTCTGSMEPTITCLDEATWVSPDTPERIVVGTTIAFPSSNCWEDAPDDRGTAHRVIDIKVENGETFYWPKGDGNREADGCWIPYNAVIGYMVELRRNVYPENAFLRDKVNAAIAAHNEARDELEAVESAWAQVETEYDEAIERYCGVGVQPGNCYLGEPAYSIVIGVYNRLDALAAKYDRVYAAYERAYAWWECWDSVARNSPAPGVVPPNTCSSLASSVTPPPIVPPLP